MMRRDEKSVQIELDGVESRLLQVWKDSLPS